MSASARRIFFNYLTLYFIASEMLLALRAALLLDIIIRSMRAAAHPFYACGRLVKYVRCARLNSFYLSHDSDIGGVLVVLRTTVSCCVAWEAHHFYLK